MRVLFPIFSVAVLMASSAMAKPPLISVHELTGPLIEGRAADLVRKECDSYKVNMISAISQVRGLKNKASRMGYSDDEIDAFVESRETKNFITGESRKLLRTYGSETDGICAAGDELVRRHPLADKLIYKR